MEEVSLLLEKIAMPSTDRFIEKIAIFVAALWTGFAALVAVELIGHLIDKTSDARSQLWRVIFVAIFAISALSLFVRFPNWRWIVVVACVLIAIRDYFYLMVPQELSWGFDQVLAAIRLAVAVASVAVVALWGRFGVRGPDRKVSTP